MADSIIGTIKYVLRLARTRGSGIAISGIRVGGEAPQDLSCICRLYFTDNQVIGANVNAEISGMLQGKTGAAEKFVESNPFVKNMVGGSMMEMSWVQLKKTMPNPSAVDYSATQMPDISNNQIFAIAYGAITQVKLQKQMLFGNSDYLLIFKGDMGGEIEVSVDPASHDGIVELIKKTPLAPRFKG